jgi:hypothetical protein
MVTKTCINGVDWDVSHISLVSEEQRRMALSRFTAGRVLRVLKIDHTNAQFTLCKTLTKEPTLREKKIDKNFFGSDVCL